MRGRCSRIDRVDSRRCSREGHVLDFPAYQRKAGRERLQQPGWWDGSQANRSVDSHPRAEVGECRECDRFRGRPRRKLVLERFPAPEATIWAARLLNPASASDKFDEVTESFKDFCWYIERTAGPVPDGKPRLEWQSPDDLAKVVPAFLEWCERFLRHGAAPDPLGSSVAFALATPEALEPWQIAPDALNRVTFSMLQKDRWAHLRSYAVQPIGRWHDLSAAAGNARHKADGRQAGRRWP
jgi:hypothetical protein